MAILPRLTVERRALHRRGMENTPEGKRDNRGLVIKLAILVVILGAGVVSVLRGVDLKELKDQGLELVRTAGPVAFFVGMAVLPALGFPLSPFTLSAGSVFAPTLGWPTVLISMWVALAANVSITYCLARWIARPVLEKLALRFGYKWPQVPPREAWNFTILLRVTPGPPFVVQSALLGLAEVPFKIYLIGSAIIAGLYGTAFAVFGEALLSGQGRMVLVGGGALAALMVGTQLLRKHLANKKLAVTTT
jgi:uncharacterized membrane protein YdjX (TVP38/TMEM64 family)